MGAEAGTKAPLLLLLFHRHLMVLPAPSLGRGLGKTPKKYRVNEGGFRAPWLGNKNLQIRLNPAFVIPPFFHLLSAFSPCLRESL